MNLLKLTHISKPDVNGGKPFSIYIDRTKILVFLNGNAVIENSVAEHHKFETGTQLLDAVNDLIPKISGCMPKEAVVGDGVDMEKFVEIHRELSGVVGKLSGVVGELQVNQQRIQKIFNSIKATFPPTPCTCILVSGPSASNWFHVLESPQQISDLIEGSQ